MEVGYFPNGNFRLVLPLRVIQAGLLHLLRHPDIQTVFTTGTSIGTVFGIAQFLGRRFVAVELLTRLDTASKWFTASMWFGGEFYAPSWCGWVERRRTLQPVKRIEVVVEDVPT